MFCSCRISTDRRVARSLCHSRATCYKIPECDRHIHTDRRTDRYTTTACTALSIASRGKNRHIARPTSIITRQRASVDSKLLGSQVKSVISTHLNDNALTPHNQFVVHMLYNQVCNRHGDKSNQWSLDQSLSVRGLKRRTCDMQLSVGHDIIDSSLPSGKENCF